MRQFIPYEKLSKRQELEIDMPSRNVWAISPVTRRPKNPKAYAFQLSKVIALVALSPAAGGLVGLWSVLPGFVVMILVFIVTLWRGTKIMEKVG